MKKLLLISVLLIFLFAIWYSASYYEEERIKRYNDYQSFDCIRLENESKLDDTDLKKKKVGPVSSYYVNGKWVPLCRR